MPVRHTAVPAGTSILRSRSLAIPDGKGNAGYKEPICFIVSEPFRQWHSVSTQNQRRQNEESRSLIGQVLWLTHGNMKADRNSTMGNRSLFRSAFVFSGAASSESSGTSSESGSNILIAYFSVPEDVDTNGADAVAGASIVVKDGEIMGNVQFMAGIIQETVGGDLFRIETVQQYPLDHDPLVDQAAEEQDEDARPELATHIENPDQYDTIILGCPNWWGDMPQALYTFLEEYDFSGKTIIPFCPHGGSGFSRTERTIAALQPDAIVSENGLTISRNVVADSEEDIIAWAEGLGL